MSTRAPPGSELMRTSSSRRERLLMAIIFLMLAIGLAAVGWHLAAPRLNAEEQMIVGRWYGFSGESENEQRYAWLAEERANKTTRVTFRYYYRSDVLAAAGLDVANAWDISDSTQEGTWSCEGGRFVSELREADLELSLLTKVGWFVRNGIWPKLATYHHDYQVRKLTPDEFHYDFPADGAAYRAIRVSEDFVLPEKPMTVDELKSRPEPPASPPESAR